MTKRGKMIAYSKIIVGILALGIIAILIFSAPAQAFNLSFIIDGNPVVVKGSTININANIDTQNLESPNDINYIIFRLKGQDNNKINCNFSKDGTILSDCNGITIKDVSPEASGYCNNYGYGEGCKLSFMISVDTNLFEPGTYSTFLILNANGKDTEKRGENIVINIKSKTCSVRADDGTVTFNNIQVTKNKINFYIPLQHAKNGDGFLIGQEARERFLYSFKIGNILENNNSTLKVQVNGKYRLGVRGFVSETAILTLDKTKNTVTLIGSNIKMIGTKVNFRKGC